jgi:two-component system LytT family response regulator
MMRVLIVDDERYARAGLRVLLAQCADVAIVGEASGGESAVTSISQLRPDLVFLDIQMPDLNGFDVLARLPSSAIPLVVFVTAYDAFAISAFAASALDYLLKPVTEPRLTQSLERARSILRARQGEAFRDKVQALMHGPVSTERSASSGAPAYLERISVGTARQRRVVDVREIVWIEAQSYYAALHVAGDVFLVRHSLANLADQLDPRRFVRVHRSTLVNVDCVDRVDTDEAGEQWIRLADGARRRVSRSGRTRLEQRIPRLS